MSVHFLHHSWTMTVLGDRRLSNTCRLVAGAVRTLSRGFAQPVSTHDIATCLNRGHRGVKRDVRTLVEHGYLTVDDDGKVTMKAQS